MLLTQATEYENLGHPPEEGGAQCYNATSYNATASKL